MKRYRHKENDMKRCIVFVNDHLYATGLLQLLNENFSVQAHLIHSAQELSASGDVDIILTDPITFAANLKHFLPRQSHTVILSKQHVSSDNSVTIVCYHSTSELIHELNLLFNKKTTSDTVETNLLSQRETEVLRLVASGCINKEIADKLNTSINTVLTHRKNITSKLGIKSVSGLSFYAMMNGIIAPQ